MGTWSNSSEQLMLHWRQHAVRSANEHKRVGNLVRMKHNMLGIPPVLIPSIMVFIVQLVPMQEKIISSTCFVATALCSLLYTHLDLGSRMTRHIAFAAQWDDLVAKIEYQMSLPRSERAEPDAFFLKTSDKVRTLSKDAPNTLVCDFPFCCISRKFEEEVAFDITPPFEIVLNHAIPFTSAGALSAPPVPPPPPLVVVAV